MGRVVSRDERDTGSAVASGTAQIESAERYRLTDKAFGPRSVESDLIRVQQAVAVVAARGAEHGAHMARSEGGVSDNALSEIRRQSGDLVDHALTHLDLELTVGPATF